jgi:signal transduction histidine kinase
LWLASSKGLELLRGDETVLFERNLSSVPDIHQDSTGTLWIAEYGGGLIRFQDRKFVAITTKDGLPNDLPVAILGDADGYLWVSSDHNILRLSLNDLNDRADGRVASISAVSYGIAEGMRVSECNSGSPGAWKGADGRIWFPTLRGVVAIDPTAGNRLPPPVVLEEAWANHLRLERSDRTSIPPGNDTLDFRFTALSFSAPDKARFRYRLDPYEREWVDAGPRRHAHYTNMDPGEYSFHVTAANDYGVWNERGTSVRFVLRPHYYQTAWFRALCGVILFTLLWGAYQLRLRQLHHQFERTLNARVDERTRIARELHDTLLQSAHGILLRYQTVSQFLPEHPAEAKERLGHAIAQTADFITEARDQVQGLRASSVETNDLALAISTLGEELPTGSPTDRPAAFRVGVEGETRDMHPIVRDEIYKIAGEALRNSFRHAQAGRVEVEIRYDDEQFRLRVRDDGRGIDPAVLATQGGVGHYGLRGMTERASVIGGDLVVWSRPSEGTEVELRVPASSAYATARRRAWFSRKPAVGRGHEGGGQS